MKCPDCGTRCGVIDSRATANGRVRRRRYLCPSGHRFTTIETQMRVDTPSLVSMYRQRANTAVAREQQVRNELNRVRAKLLEVTGKP